MGLSKLVADREVTSLYSDTFHSIDLVHMVLNDQLVVRKTLPLVRLMHVVAGTDIQNSHK